MTSPPAGERTIASRFLRRCEVSPTGLTSASHLHVFGESPGATASSDGRGLQAADAADAGLWRASAVVPPSELGPPELNM